MKKKLYYYTKDELQDVGDDFFEGNGWKDIYVFEIIDNVPILFFYLERLRFENTLNEMNQWLSDNEEEPENFSFVEL